MPRLLVVLAIALLSLTTTIAQTKPDKDYLVYVVSESADKIALIRFGPNGAGVDHQFETGDMPVDIDGPHGIVISPDRKFYYVSVAWPSVWFDLEILDERRLGRASRKNRLSDFAPC